MTEKKQIELLARTEAEAKVVLALEADVAAAQAKIPPVKAKTEYITQVLAYNEKLPALYEEVTKYTYNRIEYRSINASGQSLQISAHARTIGDCGRYLLNMYRAGHIFTSVAISAIPGYPAGSTGGGGGGGMMGGMMGGMPGGMPGMPTMPGMAGGMPGMPGGGMPGMIGGTSGGISGGTTTRTAISRGFDFTVTCGLVEPIGAPTYNPNAGADTSGGAAGMAEGMAGMMPGGMSGPGAIPGPGMMPGSSVPAPTSGGAAAPAK
ncbi:MAG: hypothetical protein ACYC0V_17745 [Armatimonadota bacterium]